MSEWIKINPETDDIPAVPFLLSDEFENVYVGVGAFDYYDALYWYPMPKYPFSDIIITNDKCIPTLWMPLPHPPKDITFPEPITISINKEYFKNEFKKVFEKWDYKLANGMDVYDEEEFLNDLINTI